MTKTLKKDQYNTGFTDGITYAVQQLAYFQGDCVGAAFIAIESGITIDEFLESQKRSGFNDEFMIEFFNDTFNK